MLLVLVRTVKGFSSMTPVSPSPQRPTIPNSISITSQLFATLYHSYSSVIVNEYKALGNSAYLQCSRATIVYITESLYVHSCFRCTSLEKDET